MHKMFRLIIILCLAVIGIVFIGCTIGSIGKQAQICKIHIGNALDLFAGTGSISFELLSRGCRQVTSVEKNNAHASFIAKVAKELKTSDLNLIRGDVFRYIQSVPSESFDFIFADPPYALKELPEIPGLVLERNLLRPGGSFVMEHPAACDFSNLPLFSQHRVYGAVNFSIFEKAE